MATPASLLSSAPTATEAVTGRARSTGRLWSSALGRSWPHTAQRTRPGSRSTLLGAPSTGHTKRTTAPGAVPPPSADHETRRFALLLPPGSRWLRRCLRLPGPARVRHRAPAALPLRLHPRRPPRAPRSPEWPALGVRRHASVASVPVVHHGRASAKGRGPIRRPAHSPAGPAPRALE